MRSADSWVEIGTYPTPNSVNAAREALKITQEYRVGIRPDGRYCLACGKPLYGPELSHTPPAQPSAVDRWRISRTDPPSPTDVWVDG